MRRATLALVSLFSALGSSAAAADERTNRFHVGAGASYALTSDRASADLGGSASVSLDGLPFEDEDVAWRAFAGWSPADGWTLEAGYAALGRFRAESLLGGLAPVLVTPGSITPGLAPSFPGDVFRSPLAGVAFVTPATTPGPDLEVSAWTFAATYARPFAERWYGAVTAGLAFASFEADGSLPVIVSFPNGFANYPFETPDDETGWLWGVAVGWRFAPSWSVEFAYRQYDVKVVEVETVGLDLRYSF